MSSKVQYIKSGTTINCDSTVLPRPIVQAEYPLPAFNQLSNSYLNLSIASISSTGLPSVQVSSALNLPGPAGSWTLNYISYQGSIPVNPVWQTINIPNLTVNSLIPNVIPSGTFTAYLSQTVGTQTLNYAQVSITTSADSTYTNVQSILSEISTISTTIAGMATASQLSPAQVAIAEADYNSLVADQTTLHAQTVAAGLPTSTYATLDTDLAALNTYLTSLTNWGSSTLPVTIVPSTWLSEWNTVFTDISNLETTIDTAIQSSITSINSTLTGIETSILGFASFNQLSPAQQVIANNDYNKLLSDQSILQTETLAAGLPASTYATLATDLTALNTYLTGISGWLVANTTVSITPATWSSKWQAVFTDITNLENSIQTAINNINTGALGSGGNYIPNGTSELGPIAGTGSNMLYDTTNQGYLGSRYVRAINHAGITPASYALTDKILCNPGDVFDLSGMVCVPTNSGSFPGQQNPTITVIFYDASNNPISNVNSAMYLSVPPGLASTPGVWTNLYPTQRTLRFGTNYYTYYGAGSTFACPYGTPVAGIGMYTATGVYCIVYINTNGYTGELWFDNLTFTKTSKLATTAVPGAIQLGAGLALAADGTTTVPTFSGSTAGLVPASSGGTSTYLRADGTFAAVSGAAGGTVTSLTASSPLTGGTITSTGTIGIQQANTSQSGYLSNTDWNTFNNKLSAQTWGGITGSSAQASPSGGWTGDNVSTGKFKATSGALYGQLGPNDLIFNRTGLFSYIQQFGIGGSLGFAVSNASAGDTLALTLASTGAATFASSVSMGALTATTGNFSSAVTSNSYYLSSNYFTASFVSNWGGANYFGIGNDNTNHKVRVGMTDVSGNWQTAPGDMFLQVDGAISLQTPNSSQINLYGNSNGAASQRANITFSDLGNNSLDITTVYGSVNNVIRLNPGSTNVLTVYGSGASQTGIAGYCQVWAMSANTSPQYGSSLFLATDLGANQGAVRLQSNYGMSGSTSGYANFGIDVSTSSQTYGSNPSALSYKQALTINGNSLLTTVGASNARPIILDSSGGFVGIIAASGGWAEMFGTRKSDNSVMLGAFGAFGGGDTCSYCFIGTDYNSPWMKVDPSGNGTFFGNRVVVMGYSANTPSLVLNNPGQYIGIGNLGANQCKIANTNGTAWDASYPNMDLYLGYNNNLVLHMGNIGTNAATLQAAVANATAPMIGTNAQMWTYSSSGIPTGFNPYWYASDSTNTNDGTMGALYQWNGSTWVYQNQPQIITPKVTAGVISAGAIGAQALAANIVMTSIITSSTYYAGTGSAAPVGFKLSGNPFTTYYMDGTNNTDCRMEIGGSVNIGGLKAAVIANRIQGNTPSWTSNSTWTCPEGITSVTLTLQGAGGNGANGSASAYAGGGGAAGNYIQRVISVTPNTTYYISFDSGTVNFRTGSYSGTILYSAAVGATPTGQTGGVGSGVGTVYYPLPELDWNCVGNSGNDGATWTGSGSTINAGGQGGTSPYDAGQGSQVYGSGGKGQDITKAGGYSGSAGTGKPGFARIKY